jgi:signal transduction histidine kinase
MLQQTNLTSRRVLGRSLSFAEQFFLVSFVILLVGMLAIGAWVGRQIEMGVVNRTGATTALYMNSMVAPHLESFARDGALAEDEIEALDRLLSDTPLGREVVSFKIWDPDGRVIYSTNPDLVGQTFPSTPGLSAALGGEVRSKISNLRYAEHEFERVNWTRLIETYAPIRLDSTGEVFAVSEFYKDPANLEHEMVAAQRRSWLVVGVATLLMYGLLAGIVGRASGTIHRQQDELQEKVDQLTALLAQNEELTARLRVAGARTTALNERFLRRISADVHDGPCQELALSLLRFDELSEACQACPLMNDRSRNVRRDFQTIHSALQTALKHLRSISASLRMPELEQLSVEETVERAVREYERRTGVEVDINIADSEIASPLPVKITLFRLIQESLTNGYRHGDIEKQRVRLESENGMLAVEIADNGKGFDPATAVTSEQLGIAGMRERVEVLGGMFQIRSAPGQGTVVRATLPATLWEVTNERDDSSSPC